MQASYILHLGDCLEVMPGIPDGSIDAIIADWPYGTTELVWDEKIDLLALWGECWGALKENGVIVLTATQPFTSELVCSQKNYFKYEWVWEKNQPVSKLNAHYAPLKIHETILVFSRASATPNQFARIKINYNPQGIKPYGKIRNGIRERSASGKERGLKGDYTQEYTNYPRSIVRFDIDRPRLHPTQKPVALMEYLIKTYTNPGDLVLDNTMGSGSTGEACLNTGRRFIGIEKDPGYFEIAQTRLERVEQELREAQIAKERQPYLIAEVANAG